MQPTTYTDQARFFEKRVRELTAQYLADRTALQFFLEASGQTLDLSCENLRLGPGPDRPMVGSMEKAVMRAVANHIVPNFYRWEITETVSQGCQFVVTGIEPPRHGFPPAGGGR